METDETCTCGTGYTGIYRYHLVRRIGVERRMAWERTQQYCLSKTEWMGRSAEIPPHVYIRQGVVGRHVEALWEYTSYLEASRKEVLDLLFVVSFTIVLNTRD